MISPTPSATGTVVEALNQFGLRLFHKLSLPSGDQTAPTISKNIFFSPFSVAAALAMAYDGASGQTQKAMADVLGLEGLSRDEVNKAYAGLMAALTSRDSDMQLEIANSLWARKGVPLKPEYIQRNRESYHAEIEITDFSPAAVQRINAWVGKSTHGKITEIIQRLDPLSMLVLLDAIYFKGKWLKPFDKRFTKDGPFTLLDGQQKICPMMSSMFQTFRSYETSEFQAVRLPYRGRRASMVVVLPRQDFGLDRLVESLSVERWEMLITPLLGSGSRDVIVQLPRFTIEYETTLNAALKTLGMQVAFDRELAEFDEMCHHLPEGVYIDQVIHKAYVDVNEEGTEAAATTAFVFELGGLDVTPIPIMVVDHPFFLAIRDDRTGALLFAGAIVDP